MRDGGVDLHLLADQTVCESAADRVRVGVTAEQNQQRFAPGFLQGFLELPKGFNSVHEHNGQSRSAALGGANCCPIPCACQSPTEIHWRIRLHRNSLLIVRPGLWSREDVRW